MNSSVSAGGPYKAPGQLQPEALSAKIRNKQAKLLSRVKETIEKTHSYDGARVAQDLLTAGGVDIAGIQELVDFHEAQLGKPPSQRNVNELSKHEDKVFQEIDKRVNAYENLEDPKMR